MPLQEEKDTVARRSTATGKAPAQGPARATLEDRNKLGSERADSSDVDPPDALLQPVFFQVEQVEVGFDLLFCWGADGAALFKGGSFLR